MYKFGLMKFSFSAPNIMSVEGDGEDGGGGGGGGPELGDGVRDLIVQTVNAAVSSQLGRKLPAVVESTVTGAIAKAMEPLHEQLSKQRQGGGDEKDQTAQQIKNLQAQLADRDRRDQERAEAEREMRKRGAVKDALLQAGVRPVQINGAMAEILPHVKMSETGVEFVQQRNGYDEQLTLENGIKEWSSSDVGKAYLRPVDTAGSGARQAQGQGSGRQPASTVDTSGMTPREARVAQARAALAEQSRLLVGGAMVNIAGGGGDGDGQ